MNILILGATSEIAQQVALRYSGRGKHFVLVARSEVKLSRIATDLRIRSQAKVTEVIQDFDDLEHLKKSIQSTLNLEPIWDLVLIAFGILGDPILDHNDCERTKKILINNFLSPAMILTEIAGFLESQKSGQLVVISSVAGDRGRASNYVYGSAKAGISAYASGLRQRLQKSWVHVLTVKPGFVDTPMTAHIAPKGFLWAKAYDVAKDIDHAIAKEKSVLYTPWFWSLIMFIIKMIPEFVFKKIKL